jgi:pyrroloquinoline quinone biosynthesis protein B
MIIARACVVALLVAVAFAAIGATGDPVNNDSPYIVVLGVTQDAGYPQAGCAAACCAPAWRDASRRRHVACLAVVDPRTSERWIIDATPDFRAQLRRLDEIATPPAGAAPPHLAGVLLTHGHVGHYTGLMFLGHESIGADGIPVHVMPRMAEFLSTHGPWDQLVRYRNIELRGMTDGAPVALNDRITATPFRVPHREEYTEVVGFRIAGPERSVVFIPDVDKWERWDTRIEDVVAGTDVAFLDGTFFADGELPHRDMSAIPHPFIAESMERFAGLPAAERAKVRFIHLNHTNPALDAGSEAVRAIRAAGFDVAREGTRHPL